MLFSRNTNKGLKSFFGIFGPAVLLCCTLVHADESVPLWALASGQEFTAEIATHRVSRIVIGDQTDNSNITDLAFVDYHVGLHPSGDRLLVSLDVRSLERITRSPSGDEHRETVPTDSLPHSGQLALEVFADGTVVLSDGRETPSAAGRTEEPGQDSSQAVRSWFDAPFRIPHQVLLPTRESGDSDSTGAALPVDNSDSVEVDESRIAENRFSEDTSRRQSLQISMGPLGRLSGQIQFRVETIDTEKSMVHFTAGGELQHVAPADDSRFPLAAKNFRVDTANATGQGIVRMYRELAIPVDLDVTTQLEIQGTGEVMFAEQLTSVTLSQTFTQHCMIREVTPAKNLSEVFDPINKVP